MTAATLLPGLLVASRRSALTLVGLLITCGSAASASVFVTWAGAEPDKGACAWYIKRMIDEKAEFVVVPHGASLPEGTAFDVPQSAYRRTHNASAFQMLVRAYPSEDPIVNRLAALMHDIEINLWRPKVYVETAALVQRVREIEDALGTDDIPMDCFVAFFDGVYEWLEAGRSDAESLAIPAACQPAREQIDSGTLGSTGETNT